MDLKDLFRSLFGINSNHRFGTDDNVPAPFHHHHFDDPAPEDSQQETYIFQSPFDGMMREMNEIFQHLDETMQNMGLRNQFPNFATELPPGLNRDEPESLRDNMLKDSDGSERGNENEVIPHNPKQFGMWKSDIFSHRNNKQDSDVDGVDDLDQIFGQKKNMNPSERSPHFHSHYQSVSVRTIRTPDGKVETHRTVRDSSGKEETTVTTTHSDNTAGVGHSYGSSQTKHFWPDIFNFKRNNNTSEQPMILPEKDSELDTHKKSIFDSLFGNHK